MRKIYYSSGYVLTGDLICKALLRYARALARIDQADIVTIPVIDEDGNTGFGHLLIGPASEVFSVPFQTTMADPEAPATIDDMERKTRELQPHRPVWSDEMKDIPDLDYDYS
jgi:hypothetical protein